MHSYMHVTLHPCAHMRATMQCTQGLEELGLLVSLTLASYLVQAVQTHGMHDAAVETDDDDHHAPTHAHAHTHTPTNVHTLLGINWLYLPSSIVARILYGLVMHASPLAHDTFFYILLHPFRQRGHTHAQARADVDTSLLPSSLLDR